MSQLEAFAKRTHTPLGFLFLQEPPEERLPIPDLRSKQNGARRPSPELLDTIYSMQLRQDWMRDYLLEEGHEPLPIVGSAGLQDDPGQIADSLRQRLKLSAGWADAARDWQSAGRLLREHIEAHAGVMVVSNGVVGNNTHRPLDVAEFRGFVLVDAYAPLIFVNGADAKSAQMFTLAHELAHVCLGRSGVVGVADMLPADSRVERFCDQVAAEFLVPTGAFQDAWSNEKDVADTFRRLARRFKVSPMVVARRALDLGKISREAFFEFWHACQQQERSTKGAGGGDFWATQNTRIGTYFGEAVVQAVQEGTLLYRDAYRLTGLSADAFSKYLQQTGIDVA